MGGKTGTAQKADGSGKYGDGRMASFIGITPIEAPRFLILTMVDEPQTDIYGGVVATPAFQQIASKLLAYQGLLADAQLAAPPTAAHPAAPDPRQPAVNAAIRHLVQAGAVVADGRVPDVVGHSVRRAVEVMAASGVVPQVRGAGPVVIQQDPPPGGSWNEESKGACVLWLSEQS